MSRLSYAGFFYSGMFIVGTIVVYATIFLWVLLTIRSFEKMKDIVTQTDRFNLLTGRVPMMLNRLLSQKFREHGILLTREQWSILAILWKEDGVSQQVLADLTYRDKPSTTRLIDNLEKDHYVTRQPHESDRRQNLIFLTEKGRQAEGKIMEVLNATIEQATKGLTESQIKTIRDAFEVIFRNIKQSM